MPALLLCLALTAAAQVTGPNPPTRTAAPPPAAFPLGPNLSALLSQTQQAAQTAALDLARLRIEKWKTDSGTKRQMQQNSDSLQRNLTAALPGMLADARSNPESFTAAFKLYRNLEALYGVFLPLTQAAQMFAPNNEAQTLVADLEQLDSNRRSVANYLERLAAVRDSELLRLRNQLNVLTATQARPKKIVVDDEPKKPRKKKPAKPSAATPAPPK
jgi:hypothetical protein